MSQSLILKLFPPMKMLKNLLKKIGFPIIIRPAFTLGGSGGGIAKNEEEYEEIVHSGLQQSPINQVLVERVLQALKRWNMK